MKFKVGDIVLTTYRPCDICINKILEVLPNKEYRFVQVKSLIGNYFSYLDGIADVNDIDNFSELLTDELILELL